MTLRCWYFSGCIRYCALCFAFVLSTECLGLLWPYLHLNSLSVCSTLYLTAFNSPHSHHPWKRSDSFSPHTFIFLLVITMPSSSYMLCHLKEPLCLLSLHCLFLFCHFHPQQKLHSLPEQGSLLSPYCGPWGLENLLPFSAKPQHL